MFDNNSALSSNTTGSGGGAQIGQFVLSNGGNDTGNNVLFEACTFSSNTAYYGGGVSIQPALQDTKKQVAVFTFVKCVFSDNFACLGSAVYAALSPLIINGLVPNIHFTAVEVTHNTICDDSYKGYGTFYVNRVPVNFNVKTTFNNNTGSALAVVGTYLNLSSCEANFTNNVGQRGGAIALLGAAWILIDARSNMSFVSNRALSYGGAIFNLYLEQETFQTSTNCFIKYADPVVIPNNWTANFLFMNNSDGFGSNSIHSTSVLPCGVLSNDPGHVFCWNAHWYYGGMSCYDEISSDASNVTFFSNATIYPGQLAQLPLNVIDDIGHNVLNQTTFLGTFSTSTNSNLHVNTELTYISSGYMLISGSGSGNITLSLQGVENGQLHVDMVIKIIECPPGMVNYASTCGCDPSGDFKSTVVCLGSQVTESSSPALLLQGYWMGKIGEDIIVVGSCPSGYCDGSNFSNLVGQYIQLPQSYDQLDDRICSGNRMGTLCGRCKPGYATAINSDQYPCVQCNMNPAFGVMKYIGTVFLPLNIFFLFIILFNIKLTMGPANAFIVFSQVISSTFDVSLDHVSGQNANILAKVYTFIYGIANLDFVSNVLDPFCILNGIDTLDVITLSYLVALYPLLMIICVITCFKIKSIIGCCTCKSSRCNISISPMMAITCFLLLSYNKLILTASLILSEVKLMLSNGTYVDNPHVYVQGYTYSDDANYRWKYASVAAIILTITSILPVLLIGHPVRMFEWCLGYWPCLKTWYPADKVNIFLDCFQGSFKNDRRFFASLYFMFRIGVAIGYILPITEITDFIIQQLLCTIMSLLTLALQPYKERSTNLWDCFVFLDLAIINILSMYMSENGKSNLPLAIQFILIMLPFLCMVIYCVWNLLPLHVKKVVKVYCSINNCKDGGNGNHPSHDEDVMLLNRSVESKTYTELSN